MKNLRLGIGLVVVWALVGWSQCVEVPCLSFDGPTVAFKLCVQVAGGTCSNVPKTSPAPSDTVRCSVSEGASGTVDLILNRTAPDAFTGGIVLTGSIPGGWPTFTPVSKSGSGNMSLTAQYRFTVPLGTAGRTLELKFKAVADGCYGELILTVVFDVAAKPSGPQLYGPSTGATDANGKFSIPIEGIPNARVTVSGTLTECTVRLLSRTPVTIHVATTAPVAPPSFGMAGLVWASYPVTPVAQQAPSISYILISAPGYPQVKVTQFFVLPITIGGTTHFMVDVGTVSLPAMTCQAQPPGGGIGGTTDSAGNFRVNVGSGTTVSGRLTECTVKPLPNQTFTVVPKFSGGDLEELKFVVPGYADTTVTQAVSVFHMGTVTYINLGDVCMLPKAPDSEKPDGGITGKTDSNGRFTATIKTGTTVSGRLTVCTVTPIPDAMYSVTPEYGTDGAITAFRFSVSGYGEATVTQFSKLSISGLTWHDVGTVCLPRCVECQNEESPSTGESLEEIPWTESRRLTWDYFKGQTPAERAGDAMLRYGLLPDRKYESTTCQDPNTKQWTATVTKYEPRNVMVPSESWVDPEHKTEKLLSHEQGHFDINEVYRRVLEREARKLVGRGATLEAACKDLQEQLNGLFARVWKKSEEQQDQYDKGTDHGTKEDKQEEWNTKIRDWLTDPTQAPAPDPPESS